MEADVESRAKAAGHAIHQQLVVYPVGLLTTAVAVLMIVLFAVNWFLRTGAQGNMPTSFAFILELLAAVIAFGTAWLGGELVARLAIGVDDGAGLDAPAKLTTGISFKRGQRQAS
jgi:uncharacterized membrane protein